ncbi:hypothetical protein ACHAWT_001127 [Skeletonema menzelii]
MTPPMNEALAPPHRQYDASLKQQSSLAASTEVPMIVACNMLRRQSSSDDDLLFLHPGPVDLIYGAENPLRTELVARHLSSVRRRRKRIQHLSLLGSELVDPEGIFRLLGKKLKKFNVKELAINQIPMSNQELISLAPFLNGTKTLKTLDLSGAAFDAKALQEIRCFFMKNTSLEVLNLGDNQCVGDEGAAVVSALQEGRAALRTLSMKGCGLGNSGVASISKVLGKCPSLRILELSNNSIGDAGVELLAETIKSQSCQLEFLGLNSVEVGDRGVLVLADAVKNNRSLTSLSLQNNRGITSFGAAHLLKSTFNTQSLQSILAGNHVLTNVDIRGCSRIGESLLKLAEELLSTEGMATHQVIRFKVSKYTEKKGNGIALEGFDPKLLPHILSFVGQTNGLSYLFQSIRSMPPLHSQYELSPKAEEVKLDDFLASLKAAKRAKKVYERYVSSFPKQRSIMRYQGGRRPNKHEAPMKSLSCNNKFKNSLSSQRNLLYQVYPCSSDHLLPPSIYHFVRFYKISMELTLYMLLT